MFPLSSGYNTPCRMKLFDCHSQRRLSWPPKAVTKTAPSLAASLTTFMECLGYIDGVISYRVRLIGAFVQN